MDTIPAIPPSPDRYSVTECADDHSSVRAKATTSSSKGTPSIWLSTAARFCRNVEPLYTCTAFSAVSTRPAPQQHKRRLRLYFAAQSTGNCPRACITLATAERSDNYPSYYCFLVTNHLARSESRCTLPPLRATTTPLCTYVATVSAERATDFALDLAQNTGNCPSTFTRSPSTRCRPGDTSHYYNAGDARNDYVGPRTS
jgi:hypothetical protein